MSETLKKVVLIAIFLSLEGTASHFYHIPVVSNSGRLTPSSYYPQAEDRSRETLEDSSEDGVTNLEPQPIPNFVYTSAGGVTTFYYYNPPSIQDASPENSVEQDWSKNVPESKDVTDHTYSYSYKTDTSSKTETRDKDGNVEGTYTYIDGFGKERTVKYTVKNGEGFVAYGDIHPFKEGSKEENELRWNFGYDGSLWWNKKTPEHGWLLPKVPEVPKHGGGWLPGGGESDEGQKKIPGHGKVPGETEKPQIPEHGCGTVGTPKPPNHGHDGQEKIPEHENGGQEKVPEHGNDGQEKVPEHGNDGQEKVPEHGNDGQEKIPEHGHDGQEKIPEHGNDGQEKVPEHENGGQEKVHGQGGRCGPTIGHESGQRSDEGQRKIPKHPNGGCSSEESDEGQVMIPENPRHNNPDDGQKKIPGKWDEDEGQKKIPGHGGKIPDEGQAKIPNHPGSQEPGNSGHDGGQDKIPEEDTNHQSEETPDVQKPVKGHEDDLQKPIKPNGTKG